MSFQANELLNSLISEAAAKLGYTIYSSRIYHRSGQTVIDVRIDNNDVISHQDCRNYSAELARLIENSENDINYYLEVSSPGVNRELRNIDEYRRFLGSKIKVKFEEDDKVNVIKGELLNLADESLEVKSENKILRIRFDKIKKTNLDY